MLYFILVKAYQRTDAGKGLGKRMEEHWKNLADWIVDIREYEPTTWERLPELDLYMDQVITLMDKQLTPFTTDGSDKLLTPSMINNYVKDEVLPRPVKKKYSRDHLAMLMMICILKPVLSLPEIHEIIRGLVSERRVEEMYPDFAQKQQRTLQEVADRMQEFPEYDRETLYRKAVGLALEAAARRIAAERILAALSADRPAEDEEAKKSKKKADGETPAAE